MPQSIPSNHIKQTEEVSLRRRSNHGSRSRWLVEQVRWEVARDSSGLRRASRAAEFLRDSWDRHPFIWSSAVQAAAFAVAWTVGALSLFPCITAFGLDDPSAAIATAWQVLAGFASIAFAGLAVLMQLTSEPVVTSRGVRQVLFRESQFQPVLAFSIVGAIQVGVATLFLNQPESAVVEVALVAGTIFWIGLSYARVGLVYANPGAPLRLGEKALLDDLRNSMREAHILVAAETRLNALVPHEWRWSTTATIDGEVLLAAIRAGTLVDVDVDLLTDIIKDVKVGSSAIISAPVSDGPGEPSTEPPPPELRTMVSIGSTIDAGQEIFILKNASSYTGDRTKLRSRLIKTLRWEDNS